MGSVRFADLQTRPTEVLDLTSLTLDEFRPLVPPFEAAFPTHMVTWRRDGKPRPARRYTTDQHCPLPTPEDRLLCILVYLKTSSRQVVPGRWFGMGQSKAPQWLHGLVVVLRATLGGLGDAPTRSVTELAMRLGVAEAEAAAMGGPTEESPPSPTSPLVDTLAPNGVASAPRIRRSSRAVIAARKHPRRCKPCCCSTPRSPSACGVRLRQAVATIHAWPMPPRTRCPRGAGGSKLWAFWHVHSRRWR